VCTCSDCGDAPADVVQFWTLIDEQIDCWILNKECLVELGDCCVGITAWTDWRASTGVSRAMAGQGLSKCVDTVQRDSSSYMELRTQDLLNVFCVIHTVHILIINSLTNLRT
jgi:hypothetical protein